ncbi:hypothetical protein [Hwanghaeella sp.]|uniref:hypothetical protein n=1 Tax=Hwanghaeella sp. TaxID=2605943 RepID=UPI003CCBF374
MGNSIAYAALFTFPIIAFFLFVRFSTPAALVSSILAGYLLLPVGVSIKVPAAPDIEKQTITVLTCAVLCLLFGRSSRSRAHSSSPMAGTVKLSDPKPLRPRPATNRVFAFLALLAILMPFYTYLNNQEHLVYGPSIVLGMTLFDTLSFVQSVVITLLPLYLGYKHLRRERDQKFLLSAISIAGLLYSLPILFEIRMSPQLHVWVYGFFPHSFLQQARGDGFRSVVFLGHGLAVAIFLAMAIIASWGLSQGTHDKSWRTRWRFAAFYLVGVLVLQKSLGALILVIGLVGSMMVLRERSRALLLFLIGILVITYPILRGSDLFPTQSILALVETISPERGESLSFRLNNEDRLLDKAAQKPIAGWGSNGRNRVFDPETGNDISVTDGFWVIIIGIHGWIGYLAFFGLLTLPLFLIRKRYKRYQISPITLGLAFVLAVKLIDLLPNAGLAPITWLVAGSLVGSLLPSELELREPAPMKQFAKASVPLTALRRR